MIALDKVAKLGVIVSLAVVAGTQGFLVYEASQNRAAQNEIVTLINDRHTRIIERISADSMTKLIALKDSERVCAVAQEAIETTTYFKGKSIHGC